MEEDRGFPSSPIEALKWGGAVLLTVAVLAATTILVLSLEREQPRTVRVAR